MLLQDILTQALPEASADGRLVGPVSMSVLTTFRTGGPADMVLDVKNEEELRSALSVCAEHDIPWTIIGNGSNLLVRDGGLRGLVIRIHRAMGGVVVLSGNRLRAEAGATLHTIAQVAQKQGLSGMEALSGIPGTVGGALLMNAGAYERELKDVLLSAQVLETDGTVKEYANDELALGYRTSLLQHSGGIVLGVTLQLKKGEPDEIRGEMEEYARRRREKQPLEYPSAGSTFKRPEGHFAGVLIEEAGLRGYVMGRAAVSAKHAGFIVNLGGATTQEICTLMAYVQKTVFASSRVWLEMEVHLVGEEATQPA